MTVWERWTGGRWNGLRTGARR